MMKPYVLIPVASSIEPACEKGLVELERRGYQVWKVRGYSAIDQARSQIATDALATGAEETFWIDSDIAFSPDDVDRIRSLGLPIVAGIYPKKGKRELACHVMPGTHELTLGKRGSLVEILYAGAGFLYVRREVYEAMQKKLKLPACNLERGGRPLVPFFLPMVLERPGESPWYLAEDFAFCERVRQCGYKIMADTRVRLAHIGSYAYSWEDAGSAIQRFGTYTFRIADAE